MKATLIKKLDNGWPVYSLRRADGKMIATTRFPFDEPALMIAKNAGIELQKLSHEKCDEIFGVVNVEKLATEVEESLDFREFCSTSFKLGVNKAMELNGDKQFTLDDVRNAIQLARYHSTHNKNGILVCFHEDTDKIIQSLQQPKEIEVEIEMEVADLAFYENGERYPIEANIPERFKYKPKLDSEGCLILKKI
jgi:hypothetical protein